MENTMNVNKHDNVRLVRRSPYGITICVAVLVLFISSASRPAAAQPGQQNYDCGGPDAPEFNNPLGLIYGGMTAQLEQRPSGFRMTLKLLALHLWCDDVYDNAGRVLRTVLALISTPITNVTSNRLRRRHAIKKVPRQHPNGRENENTVGTVSENRGAEAL